MGPAEGMHSLIDCWGIGEMIFFHSVPHSSSLRFISPAFTPVNQVFTRGRGCTRLDS